jgi:hypothetical protein
MVGTQPRRRGARYASAVRRGRHHVLARERGAAYRGSEPDGGQGSEVAAGHPSGSTAEDAELLERLDGLVEVAVAAATVDTDLLSDAGLRAALARVQTVLDRLGATRTRLTGVVETRALRAAGPGRESQALRVTRQELAEDLRLSPSEVKRAGETGRRLADSSAASAALADGQLPAGHAKVLADTLGSLSGSERDHAEQVLLEAATSEDLQRFGRTSRRLLAQLDEAAAQRAQERRNARRQLKVAQTLDGMTAVHGQGSGWDAEVVQTALHAFRRPDAPDEVRTSEQRSWDALVSVCQAALDVGVAAANRNVRPHVLVTIDHETLLQDAGVVDTAWSGPLPWAEVRRHLADVGVSRLLVDPAGLPVEAGEAVRTVPAGLWKLLQVRDGTCIGAGCDVPAAWCQVMHLDVPFRFRGQLTPQSAAPGCSYHHRMLDQRGWTITWIAGRPVLHHPDRPPGPEDPDGPGPPRGPGGPSGPDGGVRSPRPDRGVRSPRPDRGVRSPRPDRGVRPPKPDGSAGPPGPGGGVQPPGPDGPDQPPVPGGSDPPAGTGRSDRASGVDDGLPLPRAHGRARPPGTDGSEQPRATDGSEPSRATEGSDRSPGTEGSDRSPGTEGSDPRPRSDAPLPGIGGSVQARGAPLPGIGGSVQARGDPPTGDTGRLF